MSDQPSLFDWADARPTSVIDARLKFERRTVELAAAIVSGRVPCINGELVILAHRRAAKIAIVGEMRGAQ